MKSMNLMKFAIYLTKIIHVKRNYKLKECQHKRERKLELRGSFGKAYTWGVSIHVYIFFGVKMNGHPSTIGQNEIGPLTIFSPLNF